jgi:hypothetical protein
MRSMLLTFAFGAAAFAFETAASAAVTIQTAQGGSNARFTGNSFAGGTGPGGGQVQQTSTGANVTLASSGGGGSTSGGLEDVAGTTTYGSAITTVTVTANSTQFKIHFDGAGDMNAPAGYNNLTISASVDFFDVAILVTGAGNIPYTVQKTGGLSAVNWTITPEPGTGASLGAGTLTAGSYSFHTNGGASLTYNFGNGGAGNVHRTFTGDYIITFGATTPGVCCRGATCNSTLTQAQCTPPGGAAGALYVTTTTTCNTATNNKTPCCYSDYDKSGAIAIADIFAFLNDWFAARPTTVFAGNGTTGTPAISHIFSFLNAWFLGCS